MNKKEFLAALSKQLRLLPKEDREDAITFYTEYLEDSGFDENEDVTAKLGKPKEVAKNIIADCTMKHIEQNEEKKSAKKTASIIWLAIISILTLPITLPLAVCLVILALVLLLMILFVFVWFLAIGIIVMGSGVAVFFAGIFAPGIGQKLVCFGTSAVLLGVGLAICSITIILFILIIRLIVKIIKKSVSKNKAE